MTSKEVEDSKRQNSYQKEPPQGYTYEEDIAIVNYITTNKRYLLSSGVKVWKDAEKIKICPGRPYYSLKERYRKIIVKDLKKYNVETALAKKISEFMRATKEGKRLIRLKESR